MRKAVKRFLQWNYAKYIMILGVVLLGIAGLILIFLSFLESDITNDAVRNLLMNIGITFLSSSTGAALGYLTKLLVEQERIYRTQMDFDEFIETIGTAKERITILNTWTRLLDEEQYRGKFLAALENALKINRIEVLILILAPDADYVEVRAKELRMEPELVRTKIRKCLSYLDDLNTRWDKDASERDVKLLSTKLYNKAPAIALNWADNRAYLGFYPKQKLSSQEMQLSVDMETVIGTYVQERLNALLLDDETLSISEYNRLHLAHSKKGETNTKYIKLNNLIYVYHNDCAPLRLTIDDIVTIASKTYRVVSEIVDGHDIQTNDDLKDRARRKYDDYNQNTFYKLKLITAHN